MNTALEQKDTHWEVKQTFLPSGPDNRLAWLRSVSQHHFSHSFTQRPSKFSLLHHTAVLRKNSTSKGLFFSLQIKSISYSLSTVLQMCRRPQYWKTLIFALFDILQHQQNNKVQCPEEKLLEINTISKGMKSQTT